jgi:hypothetical protein
MTLRPIFVSRAGKRSALAAVAITLGVIVIGRCGTFVVISGKNLERMAKDAGFPEPPHVSRNGSGTMLFLTAQMPNNTALVEIISADGITFKRFAPRRVELDNDGNLISWVTNRQTAPSPPGVVKALAFGNGDEIPLVFTNAIHPGSFVFSWDGDYFLLDQPTNAPAMLPGWTSAPQPMQYLTPSATNIYGSWPRWRSIFRTSAPTKPLFRLPKDFYARDVFNRSNQVLVPGLKLISKEGSKTVQSEFEEREWMLIFSEGGSSYKLTGQLDLSRFGGVLDVDPATGLLLVIGQEDILAKWGLFDPKTGNYKSLGFAKEHGFFLDPEFSKYLEEHWKCTSTALEP